MFKRLCSKPENQRLPQLLLLKHSEGEISNLPAGMQPQMMPELKYFDTLDKAHLTKTKFQDDVGHSITS
jgi:hypothetical protein